MAVQCAVVCRAWLTRLHSVCHCLYVCVCAHPARRDGLLEVVLGTSMGFLYVLDATTGNPLTGWPIQVRERQCTSSRLT